MLLLILMEKDFLECFTKMNRKKEFGIETVIKRKGDKLNVKWKGNDNLFNS